MGEIHFKKSNSLIYSLGNGTALGYKLFAAGMANIWINENNCVVSTMYRGDIKESFNYSSDSVFASIKAYCNKDSAKESIFDWKICVKDYEKGKYQVLNAVEDASYNNGKLVVTYNSAITSLIANVDKYCTMLSLSEFMSLKSKYSMRLYELLKADYDYKKTMEKHGHQHDIEYKMVELKLGVIDCEALPLIKEELEKDYPDYDVVKDIITENDYDKNKAYYQFNQLILSKAVRELNEKTSLRITYVPIQRGRYVLGIAFKVDRD